MEISNIRIEHHSEKAFLKADITCNFCPQRTIWFSVDEKYADWLTEDVYDAFLVEAIFPAMFYKEDVVIHGKVNRHIYRNLVRYIAPIIEDIYPGFKQVNIKVDGFAEYSPSTNANIVGTGFSGGVDSFSTLIDNYLSERDPDYKVNTLFFFNVGQYPGADIDLRRENALMHYNNSNRFAQECGLDFVFLDSNISEYYLPAWEYDAGPLCRICSILVFERVLKRYYLSGSMHYKQQNRFREQYLDDVTDEFIYTMLCPRNIEIILDGNQYYRSTKIASVANYEPSHRHLNVCVNPKLDLSQNMNCGSCFKCVRTLIIIESMGRLNDYKNIFNLSNYQKVRRKYLSGMILDYGKGEFFNDENVDFARAHGIKFPSKPVAWIYVQYLRVTNKIKRLIKKS